MMELTRLLSDSRPDSRKKRGRVCSTAVMAAALVLIGLLAVPALILVSLISGVAALADRMIGWLERCGMEDIDYLHDESVCAIMQTDKIAFGGSHD